MQTLTRGRWGWHSVRLALWGVLLLAALLAAACSSLSPDGAGIYGPPQATPTATDATPDAASAQDLVGPPTPTPTPTVTATPQPQPTATPAIAAPPAPVTSGKAILVSLSRQWLYAYDNGTPVFANAVETGRPELPTPAGTYHIFYKVCSDQRWTTNSAPAGFHNPACTQHNGDGFQEVFNSPFPQGSPYWYYPTHINYAMEFLEGGYYLHDAWWHVDFGPGSNVPHKLPNGTWETGSHGCVGMTIANAQRLYAWAPVGTPVYVRATQ